jgi:hypothetical protein
MSDTWRRYGTHLAAAAVAVLVLAGCSAFSAGEVTPEQRSWCLDHQLPDPSGGSSVAASARALDIASPEVERALGALEATAAEGARLLTAAARAEASGDQAAITGSREAYATWQSEVSIPAQRALGEAMGSWSTTPEWAEACAHAFDRRGTVVASPVATLPVAEATPEPTTKETPAPTPTPKPTPRLIADRTIHYTSSTYVGRLIELTVKVRNPAKLKAGKVSVQVEGLGYSLASRTPVVGCIPNCRSATEEGIAYVEWTAPAPGKTVAYTVQLKAKRAGTYRIEVRAYRGPAADPVVDLATWTVKVRVR